MADAPIYFYEAEIDGIGAKDLQIASGKLPAIAGGAPPEFKGREGVWAPEYLFVAAFNNCYLLTLLTIAEFSGIAIVSCSVWSGWRRRWKFRFRRPVCSS